MNTKLLLLLSWVLFSSCSTSRDIVYFSDLKNTPEYSEEITNNVDLKIQPGDLLSIVVSSLNAESNNLFNSGVLSTGGSAGSGNRATDGYLVDRNGAINFPVLGSISLAGLTKEQATEKMVAEIKKSVKNPIVNIKFINFRITIIGEIGSPSTITVPTDKINLVEAIAMAGDLTVYGKRNNVLIIREENGIRSTIRVNLNDKSTLNSPNFYLHQNDIIYVEPAKIKSLQTSSTTFYLTTISLVVSLLSLFAFVLR